MEKLQKALEKARESRMARKVPLTEEAPQAPQAHDSAQRDLWLALPELEINPNVLMQKRIVTLRNSPDSANYDLLRTRIREEAKRQNLKRIAFVSTGPGAGKTTTLANLSFSLARLPFMRSMVFDFDLRHPALHKVLGQMPVSDMAEVIAGNTALTSHMGRFGENLCFGLNHGPVAHPAEVLQSDRTQDLLAAVEETYQPDLMLFDMPPFLVADDTQGFLSSVDAVILVVEAEKTPRAQLDAVEQKLSERTNVLGVVLNKCNFPDMNDGSYGYGYGYGYY